MIFRIEGSVEKLISYWNQMRSRHGILRTCFVSTDNARYPLVQVILEHEDFPWNRFHALDLEQCAEEHLNSLPDPVDSLKSPVDLAIVTTQNHKNFLSFVCHHALYDGVAIGRLISEIEGLARGDVLRPAPSFQPFLLEALTLPNDTDTFWCNHFERFLSQSSPPRPGSK
jgi:hypothetical protein